MAETEWTDWPPDESADNSYGCWLHAVTVMREQGVRSGKYPPINDKESRQAKEGPVPKGREDAMREPA